MDTPSLAEPFVVDVSPTARRLCWGQRLRSRTMLVLALQFPLWAAWLALVGAAAGSVGLALEGLGLPGWAIVLGQFCLALSVLELTRSALLALVRGSVQGQPSWTTACQLFLGLAALGQLAGVALAWRQGALEHVPTPLQLSLLLLLAVPPLACAWIMADLTQARRFPGPGDAPWARRPRRSWRSVLRELLTLGVGLTLALFLFMVVVTGGLVAGLGGAAVGFLATLPLDALVRGAIRRFDAWRRATRDTSLVPSERAGSLLHTRYVVYVDAGAGGGTWPVDPRPDAAFRVDASHRATLPAPCCDVEAGFEDFLLGILGALGPLVRLALPPGDLRRHVVREALEGAALVVLAEGAATQVARLRELDVTDRCVLVLRPRVGRDGGAATAGMTTTMPLGLEPYLPSEGVLLGVALGPPELLLMGAAPDSWNYEAALREVAGRFGLPG